MQNLIEILKHDEGTGPMKGGRNMPYQDSEGYWTIGFGRCIDKIGISGQEAEQLLRNDVDSAIEEAGRAFDWLKRLNAARRAVIYSMVFNLGLSRFSEFKRTIGYLEQGNYRAASAEMLDSKWARQVKGRANRLSEMMQTGEW